MVSYPGKIFSRTRHGDTRPGRISRDSRDIRQEQGEKLGTYSSATLIGRTIAPITGGAIISFFLDKGGLFPYKAVYVAAFIASIPAFLFCFFMKDAEIKQEKKRPTHEEFRESIKYFFGNGRLVSTALVDMSIYFSFGAFETYLPIYLDGKGFDPKQIGFIFSAQILSIALTKPFFGRLADRIDKRFQIAIGLFIIAASMLALPFFFTAIRVIAVSLLFGLGMSFATVATSAYTGDIADNQKLGASMGALSSVMDIGHSSGPAVTGFVIGYISMQAGFFTSAVLCVIIALVFVVFTRTRKPVNH